MFGQGVAGAAQIYSALTGNYGTDATIAQVGNTIASPVFGLGTLAAGGNMAQAEGRAGYESLATAASGLIGAINAGGEGLMTSMTDYHAGAAGAIAGDGSSLCGAH